MVKLTFLDLLYKCITPMPRPTSSPRTWDGEEDSLQRLYLKRVVLGKHPGDETSPSDDSTDGEDPGDNGCTDDEHADEEDDITGFRGETRGISAEEQEYEEQDHQVDDDQVSIRTQYWTVHSKEPRQLGGTPPCQGWEDVTQYCASTLHSGSRSDPSIVGPSREVNRGNPTACNYTTKPPSDTAGPLNGAPIEYEDVNQPKPPPLPCLTLHYERRYVTMLRPHHTTYEQVLRLLGERPDRPDTEHLFSLAAIHHKDFIAWRGDHRRCLSGAWDRVYDQETWKGFLIVMGYHLVEENMAGCYVGVNVL